MRTPWTKEKQRAATEAWAKKNPERWRAIKKKAAAKRRVKAQAERRLWAARYPERERALRERRNLRFYGMTPADYALMLKAQNDKCAICGRLNGSQKRRLCVDHHHGSKLVRGLLCGSCNTGIGLLQEQPNLLRAAANYLERHT